MTCAMAEASAPSWPGMTGSHSSPFAAVAERRGSTTATVALSVMSPKWLLMFAIWRFEAMGSVPHMMKYRVFATS